MRKYAPYDAATQSEANAGPGHEWNSYGIVGFNDGEPVIFDTDRGQVFVKVVLHPSFRKVFARVRGHVAGNGEAEYFPFIENDEVTVDLIGGSERDAVISGRLNNAIDSFPMDSVAGQDPTKNNFAFKRRRTPVIEEFAGPVTFRSALTGAFIQIGLDGSVTLKDAENAALQLSPDAFSVMGPSTPTSPPEFMFQLDFTGRHAVLQVGDAIFAMSASDASPEQNLLTVPGAFALGTIGNPALEHAISTEAVANLVFQWFTTLAAAFAPVVPPLNGSAISGVITAWLAAGMPASIQLAATTPLLPPIGAAISSAFAGALPKPNTPTGQLAPGIGSPGFLLG